MDFMKAGPYWPDLHTVVGYTLFARRKAADVDFKGDSPLAVSCRRDAEEMASLGAELHWINQVHGNKVIALPGERDFEVDGVVTSTPRVACVMRSADCLPVLFAAKDEQAVGVAHAGWKGLKAGILQATFKRLDRAPVDVLCWMGPAISAKFYEVDDAVVGQFSESDEHTSGVFEEKGEGKYYMDMYRMAENILLSLGIPRGNVSGGEFCTYSDLRMHSVRRDGKSAGRMATMIWFH